jgi:hypothetical protein
MAINFKITIPTTIDLHIMQAEVIPFYELTVISKPTVAPGCYPTCDLDQNIPSQPLNLEPNFEFFNETSLVNFQIVAKWAWQTQHSVCQLTMPGNWRMIMQEKSLLSDPIYNAAVFFIGGKNWNKISGHPNGTEMFVIDDEIYRRLTWQSIDRGAIQDRGGAITVKYKDRFAYYLLKCKSSNKDPLRSTILTGLSAGVFIKKVDPSKYDGFIRE